MGAVLSNASRSNLKRGALVSLGWRSLSFALVFLAGLALARLLYEWRFPEWAVLGRPFPAIAVAASWAILRSIVNRKTLGTPSGALILLPNLLVLAFLFSPTVDLAGSRILFLAAIWLVDVLAVYVRVPATDRRWRWIGPLLILVVLLPVYLLSMSNAVGEADTFEFQVVAPQLGIAHPTGYPLYLLLGKLFSLIPVSTVAWRLNFASAIFACLAVCVLYWTAARFLRQPLAALLGALALGLSPVFWGQAIVAEVYTLHALIVALALWLMLRLIDRPAPAPTQGRWSLVGLAAVIGLGLTNHLTTVFLIPPAVVAGLLFLLDYRRGSTAGSRWPWPVPQTLLLLAVAFLVPLLLYSYLPLRWQAINNEPMGVSRFIDWVVGGRFQGALQWMAWLRDPARWQIVGRLFLDNWGVAYLVVAFGGFIYLLRRYWRAALVLLFAFTGFTFYALNYYVPDLAVFLIPAHVVIALALSAGLAGLITGLKSGLRDRVSNSSRTWVAPLLFVLLMLPAIWRTAGLWSTLDQSDRDGGETWGRAVLSQPLAEGAAVLADSEKIAPLYYLQQIEGLRPDLEIMVLPDEAAYRAELDQRVAAGQTVYLARFLPGLAGSYFLGSAGPLTVVASEPMQTVPAGVSAVDQTFGPLRLQGYELESPAPSDPGAAALTLYLALAEPLVPGPPPLIYVRWRDPDYTGEPMPATGQHPVDNLYPVNAWQPGEIVADYHSLPYPSGVCGQMACDLWLEVSAGPAYADASELDWTRVTQATVPSLPGPVAGTTWRSIVGEFGLDAAAFAEQVRPDAALAIDYSGFGDGDLVRFSLEQPEALDLTPPGNGTAIPLATSGQSLRYQAEVSSALPNGRYALVARPVAPGAALCGWMASPAAGCVVGEVSISGVPLPEGATNFDDKVALLDIALPQTELVPGGQLPVTLTWQGLAPMSEDYTVFVQVLDTQDRIVGQVDSWPVQGTFPTSTWTPGDAVVDPYVIQLSGDLSPGEYRLHVGMYLLATARRLPVLGAEGNAVDDKVAVGGLVVP